jgi:Zinc finger, C3HC4 type (RING finger)
MPLPLSSPPTPIEGTPGTRTRVLLGDTGSEYVMVANPNDGTTQWQSIVADGGNLGGLVRQIRNCESKGRYVTAIDYHPATRAWYVAGMKRDGTGWHCWWNNISSSDAEAVVRQDAHQSSKVSLGSFRDEHGSLNDVCVVVNGRNGYNSDNLPNALANRLRRINRLNKVVHCVRLFDRGGYFVRDDQGEDWGGLQSGVANELAKSGRVLDVAIAKNGSWVVIRDESFSSSPGVTADLVNFLNLFYTRQKARNESRNAEIAEFYATVQHEVIRVANHALEQERLRQEAERAAAEARERERLEAETADVIDVLRPLCAEGIRALRDAESSKARLLRLQATVRSHLEPLSPAARAHVVERLGRDEPAIAAALLADEPRGATFGSESASASPSALAAPCVICTDSPAIRALVPCGHLCLCEDCSVQFLHSTSRACPLCRVHATSTLRIYRQD